MFSVYFAGELFSSKHLLGNVALAEAIQRVSGDEFACILPQCIEQRGCNAHAIRDQDIIALIQSDLALFNFDGLELDSGTVVEFLFAKFADLPALLLRTDIRRGGDQETEPWNLMNSFYPRTRVLCLDSLTLFQEAVKGASTALEAGQVMIDSVARAVVEELRRLLNQPPRLNPELADPVYRWLGEIPGFGNPRDAEQILEALARKRGKGLLK
jgi:nucleoside 2-deoxyribosyltransferase